MFTRSFPSSPKRRARWTRSLIGRGGICNGVRRSRKPRNERCRTCRIPDSRGPATSERPWQTAAIVRRQDARASARGAYVSGVMDAVLYLEQLADVQVGQNVLARDAICDLIRDFVALSVSNVLERFQHVLPRLVDR